MGDDKIHDDHHTCAEDDDYGGWVGFSFQFLFHEIVYLKRVQLQWSYVDIKHIRNVQGKILSLVLQTLLEGCQKKYFVK